jgi:hypothetical protein
MEQQRFQQLLALAKRYLAEARHVIRQQTSGGPNDRQFVRAMVSMPSLRNLMYTYVHAFLEQVLVSARVATTVRPT